MVSFSRSVTKATHFKKQFPIILFMRRCAGNDGGMGFVRELSFVRVLDGIMTLFDEAAF